MSHLGNISISLSGMMKSQTCTTLSVKNPSSSFKKTLVVRLKVPPKIANDDAEFSKVPPKIASDDGHFSQIPAASDLTGNKRRAKTVKFRIKSSPALTGNKCRDHIREKIAASLNRAADEAGGGRGKVGWLAVSVETQLYEVWGLGNGPNKSKYLSLLFNLSDNKNPDFRNKVLQGVFSAEKIPSLTPNDMASKARQLENQRILDAKIDKEIKLTDS